jgi:hypothetical protein
MQAPHPYGNSHANGITQCFLAHGNFLSKKWRRHYSNLEPPDHESRALPTRPTCDWSSSRCAAKPWLGRIAASRLCGSVGHMQARPAPRRQGDAVWIDRQTNKWDCNRFYIRCIGWTWCCSLCACIGRKKLILLRVIHQNDFHLVRRHRIC